MIKVFRKSSSKWLIWFFLILIGVVGGMGGSLDQFEDRVNTKKN